MQKLKINFRRAVGCNLVESIAGSYRNDQPSNAKGRWKIVGSVENPRGRWEAIADELSDADLELYDLESDVSKSKNLREKFQEQYASLKKELISFFRNIR